MQLFDITLNSGEVIRVTPTLIDRVAAETYFRNNARLGPITDNPFRAMAFLSWSAAKRSQRVSVEWEQFLNGTDPNAAHAVDVSPVMDAPIDGDDLGEPTALAPQGI